VRKILQMQGQAKECFVREFCTEERKCRMSVLVQTLKMIKEECERNFMCRNCVFYEGGCILEPVPADWKINEDITLPKGSEENG